MDLPPYLCISEPRGRWGVGWLHTPLGSSAWVEVLRSDLSFDDASDLRDAWNARGTHERKT